MKRNTSTATYSTNTSRCSGGRPAGHPYGVHAHRRAAAADSLPPRDQCGLITLTTMRRATLPIPRAVSHRGNGAVAVCVYSLQHCCSLRRRCALFDSFYATRRCERAAYTAFKLNPFVVSTVGFSITFVPLSCFVRIYTYNLNELVVSELIH